MLRALLCGSALAFWVGLAAQAQAQAQAPASQPAGPASATTPPGSAASATVSMFKAGMVVKDSAGATVGTITQVGKTSDGTAAVAVNVDGKTVGLPASALSLSPSGDEAVSSMTKAQIKAASGQPG